MSPVESQPPPPSTSPPSERSPLLAGNNSDHDHDNNNNNTINHDSSSDGRTLHDEQDGQEQDTAPTTITPIRGLLVTLMSGVLMLIQCMTFFFSLLSAFQIERKDELNC